MGDYAAYIAIGVFLALVVGLLVGGQYLARRFEASAFREYCASGGYLFSAYRPDGVRAIGTSTSSSTYPTRAGRTRSPGRTAVGRSQHSSSTKQQPMQRMGDVGYTSVMFWDVRGLRLPEFRVRPKAVVAAVDTALGLPDMEFDDGDFSRHYASSTRARSRASWR